MRWFKRSSTDSPRLLSLSPLRSTEHGNLIVNSFEDGEITSNNVSNNVSSDTAGMSKGTNCLTTRKSRIGNYFQFFFKLFFFARIYLNRVAAFIYIGSAYISLL